MWRIIAFVVIAVIGIGPALSQTEHKHKHTNATPAAAPADALPATPLDVPRWMDHAIENILTGDSAPQKPAPPNLQ